LFLRLIQKYALLGMALGLLVEAWIVIPGEALIAAATARLPNHFWTRTRIAAVGLAAMMGNDLGLYWFSHAARRLVPRMIAGHRLHLHLNFAWLLVSKFVPPLRSPAVVVLSLQSDWTRFLWYSAVTNLIWIACYAFLGTVLRHRILRLMRILQAQKRGAALAITEAVLTLATVVLFINPF